MERFKTVAIVLLSLVLIGAAILGFAPAGTREVEVHSVAHPKNIREFERFNDQIDVLKRRLEDGYQVETTFNVEYTDSRAGYTFTNVVLTR